MDPTIIVAIIGASAAIVAALIGAIVRRENRSDHSTVASKLGELAGALDVFHADNSEAHDVIREDIRTVAARLDRHIDTERRSGGDRRKGGGSNYRGPERRSGTDRRDAHITDL